MPNYKTAQGAHVLRAFPACHTSIVTNTQYSERLIFLSTSNSGKSNSRRCDVVFQQQFALTSRALISWQMPQMPRVPSVGEEFQTAKSCYTCIWLTVPLIRLYKHWPNLCILNCIRLYNWFLDKANVKLPPCRPSKHLVLIKLFKKKKKKELLLLKHCVLFLSRVAEKGNVRATT